MDCADWTISERLRRVGYGHRFSLGHDGRREVYRLADGEVIGRLSAFEAVDLLNVHATAEALNAHISASIGDR